MKSGFWGLLLLAVLPACETSSSNKRLVVPDEMRRTAPPSSGSGVKQKPPPLTPPQKYILRMAEAGRVWELELPEGTGGYEVRLPLAGGGPVEMLTSADEEMLAEAVLSAKAGKDSQPAAAGKPAAGQVVDAQRAARTRSYLGGVARVKEMYVSRRYELALIELVNLEKEYPNDARLLAMKGSLYLKLGQPKLARQAWEKALSLNPEDQGVAEALRTIAAGEE
ncbi:tetratricopeptide repeat protein [Archangium lansingense]|uniref:tetratricopeptide repeat protein n=1 Tax=Archangium lansingense TaxID=2995310 RepID=UPI003B7F30A9